MKAQSKDAHVLRPLQSAFEGEHVVGTSILGQGQKFHIFERVDYPESGGIYVYYRGLPYPKKGFPYPEAIWMNDILKKNLRLIIDLVGQKAMVLPAIGLMLTPWKYKMAMLDNFIRGMASISQWLMSGHYLKEERLSPIARELRHFISEFLREIGVSKEYAEMAGKVGSAIIDYDDAYRLRLEDICSEASQMGLIMRPRGELLRLASIVQDRETSHAKQTFKSISKAISVVMLLPKIRKAFKKAIYSVDFEKMKLDEADRYHVLLRDDYNFMGKTFAERVEIYKEFHKDGIYPPMVTIDGK